MPLEWFRDEFGDKVIDDQPQMESQFQLKAYLRCQNYSYLQQKLICMMHKAFFPKPYGLPSILNFERYCSEQTHLDRNLNFGRYRINEYILSLLLRLMIIFEFEQMIIWR